ncbi:MAG: cystathionine beta-lyase, partial [Acidobacteria bacterium]
MHHDFDRVLERRGTHSLKWDYCERTFGLQDVIPMWVADMDFEAPPAVVEAIRSRAAHGAYGYPSTPDSFWR